MKVLTSKKSVLKNSVEIEKVIYSNVAVVKYDTISSYIDGAGRLEARQYIDLSAEVQGKILQADIPLKKGQSFQKGDLLINIYNQEAKLALQAHKSRFLNILANILPDIKIDYNNNYNAWSDFFAEIKLNEKIPEMPEIKSKQEKIFLASRNLLTDYFSIKSEEIRFSKYSIFAPFTGTYMQVMAEVGAIASPGLRIAKLIRTDVLELEVPVEIKDIKWITIGDKVKVNNRDNNYESTGVVVRKSNFVDDKTQSISVFVKLNSTSENPLYKGQYLTAHFYTSEIKNVMSLPRNSLYNNKEVYTVRNGRLNKDDIEVVKKNPKSILFRGIEAGDTIVTSPLVNPKIGTKVKAL